MISAVIFISPCRFVEFDNSVKAIRLSREILVFLALSDEAYVSGARCIGFFLLV